MYRQGDVLLIPVDRDLFTEMARKLVVPSVVLALGEQTGHSHTLEGEVALFDVGAVVAQRPDGVTIRRLRRPERITPAAIRFVEVLREGCELKHQEHGAHAIPPGLYEVVRQRVYEAEDRTAYVAD